MSEGPIKRERLASTMPPPAKITIAVGDQVTIADHPAGFASWRVVEIPSHPAPSDVATLENLACTPSRIRRRAADLIAGGAHG